MNARDSLLRYLLCFCSSIGEKICHSYAKKKGHKIRTSSTSVKVQRFGSTATSDCATPSASSASSASSAPSASLAPSAPSASSASSAPSAPSALAALAA